MGVTMARTILALVLSNSVTGQRFLPEETSRSGFIAINRYDRPLEDYWTNFREKISIDGVEDKIDFHYPHVEFLTRNEDGHEDLMYVPGSSSSTYLQTQPVEYGGETVHLKRRTPRLKVKAYNQSIFEYEPVALSFVQKIPKPTDEGIGNNTKYEELATGSTENTSEGKKVVEERIHLLLNKYLTNLYSQKYNSSNDITDAEAEDVDSKTYLDKSSLWSLKNKTLNKINRFFSLFTVLQFNNTQCNVTNAAGSYLGVCYTARECDNLGGTAIGTCASGYGVCCVFSGTCGGSAQQNCSFFQSPNYPDYYPPGGAVIVPTTAPPPTTSTTNPSPTPDPRLPGWHHFWYGRASGRQNDDSLTCSFSVYKVNSNVTRFRIDFLDLELASPTNGTCVTERLVISGQNTNDIIPTICGYNTGQHIYADVSEVSGPLQLMVLSTGAYRKRFRIRVCQYSDACLEPTANCLQYYTGVTGTISSFNYDQAAMFNRSVPGYFNNLNYAICIRKEAGYCTITYRNVRNGVENPFEIPNVDSDDLVTVPRGMAGVDSIDCPDDYVLIAGTRLCGYRFNDGSVNTNLTVNAAVTDSSAGPIVVPFRTNAALAGLGFRLYYTQNRCPT